MKPLMPKAAQAVRSAEFERRVTERAPFKRSQLKARGAAPEPYRRIPRP